MIQVQSKTGHRIAIPIPGEKQMNARMNPLPPETFHVTADSYTEISRLLLDGYGKCVDVQFETTRELLNSIQQQSTLLTEVQKYFLQQWAQVQSSIKP